MAKPDAPQPKPAEGQQDGPQQKGLKISQLPLAFAVMCLVPFLMVLGNSMVIPILPKIQSTLHITRLQSGLIVSLFSIPAGLFIPVSGFLSDRLGRRPVIVPSLALYGLGGLLAGAAPLFSSSPYGWILAGRVLQGLGAAGTAPIVMALASDLFQGVQRSTALGALEAANAIGKVASPILGSLVALIAWYAPFFLYGALCVPAAMAFWFLVTATGQAPQAVALREYGQVVKKMAKSRGAALFSAFLAGFSFLLLLFGVLFYLSEFLEKTYHMDGVRKGLALAVPVAALTVAALVNGRWLQPKIRRRHDLVLTGLVASAVSLVALGFWRGVVPLFVAAGVMGFGGGLVLPTLNNLITSAVAANERGIITALYGSVRFFGVAAGPPGFAWLLEHGVRTMFLAAAGLDVLAAVAVLVWLHHLNQGNA